MQPLSTIGTPERRRKRPTSNVYTIAPKEVSESYWCVARQIMHRSIND